MKALDPMTRYREYLRRFGINEPGDRLIELSDLESSGVRFFAYAASDWLRLKAAVMSSGMVTPGGHANDDWYGFLSDMPDAATAAERIAWLETDASMPPHGLPRSPVAALTSDRQPEVGIDPAQRALVTAPTLLKAADGSVTLAAWFLPTGARIPERWTVTAHAKAPAAIKHASAVEFLADLAGSTDQALTDAASRARRLLASGTDNERLWAVQHVAETGDPAAGTELAKLLANLSVGVTIRILAAAALGRRADPAAVAPLHAALRADPDPAVRRACAQTLGRIGGTEAVLALADAATNEPDVIVRAEIVHALTVQGVVAREALTRISSSDVEGDVRDLARRGLETVTQRGGADRRARDS